MNPFVTTASGRMVDLLNPTPDMIHIADIGASVCKISRFNGHTHLPYFVGQHEVWVSEHVERQAAPHAFSHDHHEAYTTDIISPMEKAIHLAGSEAFLPAIPIIKARFDQVIFAKFGLAPIMPPRIAAAVRAGDMLALATERRDLCAPGKMWREETFPPPHPDPIKPLPWGKAYDLFMRRFAELFGHSFL